MNPPPPGRHTSRLIPLPQGGAPSIARQDRPPKPMPSDARRSSSSAVRTWHPVLPLLLLVALLFAAGCATRPPVDKPFDFALIGDTPYDAKQVTNLFPNLMRELNAADLAFVAHVGDIKAGDTPCTDDLFEARLADFQRSRHPFIYLFGDNEWTDCARLTNGFDPEERLQKLRQLFCADDLSLGRCRLPLARQSNDPRHAPFRENVRWERAGIHFVGLNIPGASNNHGKPEYAARNAANLDWLRDAFSFAKVDNARALMILIQANPFPERGSTNRVHPGFRPLLDLLETETVAFQKPVVLVHGDSHYFRIDKPLVSSVSKRRLENFTRVETFGHPDVHWLRVTADPADPAIFTFRQQLVLSNHVNHLPRPGK